ncbi:uncharacterized protein LOC120341755 isoform X2 [Styela clava]
MTLKCRVFLLDVSEVQFEVKKKDKGAVLMQRVFRHLNLVEEDYFGLIIKGTDLQKVWLDSEKKIKNQISKSGKLEFQFAVKYYPTTPTNLKEDITRYQLCLQLRKDLATDLSCSLDDLADILSYWLQSEYQGSEDNAQTVKDCLKEFESLPSEVSTKEFTDKVLSLYRKRRDMSSAEADVQFLLKTSGLAMYGIHFFEGKNTAGAKIRVGIGAKGVIEKLGDRSTISHPWNRIKNVVYKDNKFKIKLLRPPSNGDPRLKKSFIFDSEKQVYLIWRNAVDHHVFFRIGEKDKKPKPTAGSGKKPKKRPSLLRRLSSKKKKTKTESDVQEESDNIKRLQPTVTRQGTLRGRPLSQLSTSQSSVSTELPAEATYTISQEPQAESDASSIPDETKPHVIDFGEKSDVPRENADKNSTTKPQQESESVDGREYKDEDLMEAVIGKMDGTASGGSSTLLLTETILEEDEDQDAHIALPSPRKRVPPVSYARLKSDDDSHDFAPLQTSNEMMQQIQHAGSLLETDLDAEVVLSPKPLEEPGSLSEKEFEFERCKTQKEEIRYGKRTVLIEDTKTEEQYTEVWEEIEVEPASPHRKHEVSDVSTRTPQKDTIVKSPEEINTKTGDVSDNSSTASSHEGEVHFNAQGYVQMPPIYEVKPSETEEAPLPVFDDLHKNETSPLQGEYSGDQTKFNYEEESKDKYGIETALSDEEMHTVSGYNERFLQIEEQLPDDEKQQLSPEIQEVADKQQSSEQIDEKSRLRYDTNTYTFSYNYDEEDKHDLEPHDSLEDQLETTEYKSDHQTNRDTSYNEYDKEETSSIDEKFTSIKEYVPDKKVQSSEEESDEESRYSGDDHFKSLLDSQVKDRLETDVEFYEVSQTTSYVPLADIADEEERIIVQKRDSEKDDYQVGEINESWKTPQAEYYVSRGTSENKDDDINIEIPSLELTSPTSTIERITSGRISYVGMTEEPIKDEKNDVEEHEDNEYGRDSYESDSTVKDDYESNEYYGSSKVVLASTKKVADEIPPPPAHGIGDELQTREDFELSSLGIGVSYKSMNGARLPYAAASTTAATIGDDDDLSLNELDDGILYEEERSRSPEERGGFSYEETEKIEFAEESETREIQQSPQDSTSRSTSLSDITDNTDELLQPDILEKTWSYGAGLDEDSELFQILFRTPPLKRRQRRNRSEINPHEVRQGKHEAIAFKSTSDEIPVSPRRRENLSRRPFIPSWPFDPASLLNSRNLEDLDKEAILAAMEAQKELADEDRRIEEMEMMEDVELSSPEIPDSKYYSAPPGDSHLPNYRDCFPPSISSRDNSPSNDKEKGESYQRLDYARPPIKSDIIEQCEEKFDLVSKIKIRSRSPSASPRMVGEEFIPGIPDFAQSVIPYQLESTESIENTQEVSETAMPQYVEEEIDPESLKFPKPILKFSAPKEKKECLKYRYSPPAGEKQNQDDQSLSTSEASVESGTDETQSITIISQPLPENLQAPAADMQTSQHVTSSGRSTPQSATGGNSSQSEGSSSKSSSSSFPRFIHSVFPLRRSSSNAKPRGRSKTRKKHENKVTKQKNKKKPRSKSKDKKSNQSKILPTIQVTSPSSPDGLLAFPSHPHYRALPYQQQTNSLSPETAQTQLHCQYDQESLDKIVLSESDDAHSDSDAPVTARKIEK